MPNRPTGREEPHPPAENKRREGYSGEVRPHITPLAKMYLPQLLRRHKRTSYHAMLSAHVYRDQLPSPPISSCGGGGGVGSDAVGVGGGGGCGSVVGRESGPLAKKQRPNPQLPGVTRMLSSGPRRYCVVVHCVVAHCVVVHCVVVHCVVVYLGTFAGFRVLAAGWWLLVVGGCSPLAARRSLCLLISSHSCPGGVQKISFVFCKEEACLPCRLSTYHLLSQCC